AIEAAGRTGMLRLLDPFGLRGARSEAEDRSAALLYGAKPWRTMCALARNWRITQREFVHVPPLPLGIGGGNRRARSQSSSPACRMRRNPHTRRRGGDMIVGAVDAARLAAGASEGGPVDMDRRTMIASLIAGTSGVGVGAWEQSPSPDPSLY